MLQRECDAEQWSKGAVVGTHNFIKKNEIRVVQAATQKIHSHTPYGESKKETLNIEQPVCSWCSENAIATINLA